MNSQSYPYSHLTQLPSIDFSKTKLYAANHNHSNSTNHNNNQNNILSQLQISQKNSTHQYTHNHYNHNHYNASSPQKFKQYLNSPQLKRKNSSIIQSNPKSSPISPLKRQQSLNQQTPLPFEMMLKQKFQKLYQKVRLTKVGVQIKIVQVPNTQKIKYEQIIDEFKNTQKPKFKSQGVAIKSYSEKNAEKPLQICTVPENKKSFTQLNFLTTGMRKNRYKQPIQPLKKIILTNDIKNALLSVGKISPKTLNDNIVNKKQFLGRNISKQLQKQLIKKQQNMIEIEQFETQFQNLSPTKSILRKLKFHPPFDLYYYRDLIWKISYSYNWVSQTPKQYSFKIKAYIGKGNNSSLIRSILNRRTWYQIVDKIQDANFAWTQIKNWNFMNKQLSTQNKYIKVQQKLQNKYISNSVLNKKEQAQYLQYKKQNIAGENKMKQNMNFRNRFFCLKPQKIEQGCNYRIHNHFQNNFVIGNKKALFHTMKNYYTQIKKDVFQILPLTFHIKNGLEDQQYLNFLQHYYQNVKDKKQIQLKSSNGFAQQTATQNIWVLKPGENTNRGKDIVVCLTLDQIKNIIKSGGRHEDGTKKTFIIQKYIEDPILYKKRKFDIRHYLMISCHNGIIKGYWYKEGYLRTTSYEYNLKNSSSNIHLTNDAIQKYLPTYGKYEKGNKVSYQQFHAYLLKVSNKKIDFWKDIYSQMKEIAIKMIKACSGMIDPNKKNSNFQIFGLDFMVDSNCKVYLIQCNSNPCLEISSPLLRKLIPKLIQNTFEIFLDMIYPPPEGFVPKNPLFFQNRQQQNSFELVYDCKIQNRDQNISNELICDKNMMDQEQIYQDDGQQLVQ